MTQRTIGRFQKGQSGFVGKKHTEKTKRIMSENSPKYWNGKSFSKDHREKLGKAHKGKKLGIVPKSAFKKGVSYNAGEKHWAWRGGICQNKNYISWIKNKRNRIKRGIFPKHTFQEWEALIVKFDNRCATCKAIKKLTEDHIIPLSKGGGDMIENIQPLCRSCNSKKSNKVYVYTTNNKV